ncbi:MAG: cysteine desulfurase-like protein [Spirochaetota bacterium]|nr:MAG: cysteine desulfurase-like protein [Spirochaetota bacterium]
MEKIDLSPLRKQFPALNKTVDGKKRIFLDGAAGTQVPQIVFDAMFDYMVVSNANYGGYFRTSVETDEMLVGVREDVADFINAPSWEGVVLGPNMTTLTYTLMWTLLRQMKKRDEVVITRLDHGANIDSWKALEDFGVVAKYIEINKEDCTLDYEMASRLIDKKTKLVAVGLASNAVGTVNDIKRLTQMAHDAGALMFVDAVHYAPHFPIDVADLGCDFLAYSAYKCFGPHVGFLWGKKELLEELNPYRPWPSHDEVPYKYNIGTPNMEGFAGARASVQYIENLGKKFGKKFLSQYSGYNERRQILKAAMAAIAEYELGLSKKLNEGLSQIKNLKVYGITDPERLNQRCPTYSFVLEGKTSEEICKRMSDEWIYVWNAEDGAGALELVEWLDVVKKGGLLRVSLEHYNTEGEIDRFLEVLRSIAK